MDALKKQVIEAKACVEENGWELVDSYVESKSGTTSKGRKEYLRLFDDLLSSRFEIIVIKSQDRLMRNTLDWYLFLDRLQTNGKRLYLYIERKFFTTQDSLITGIKAILAEEFSRELSKKIVNAHKHRQKNGTKALITNRTFGYIKMPDGSVVVDEEQRETIVRMYQYACNYGCRVTAALLRAEGVRSKLGNTMNEASIRRIIRNPINKGVFVMNRTHFDFETKKTMHNPQEEWIYAEGLVPAIVDEELWQRANDAISARANKRNVSGRYPKGSNPGRYILSGKLVCGICGRPYYRSWRHSGGTDGKVINEWKCSGYIQNGRQNHNRKDVLRKANLDINNGCDNVHVEEEIVFQCLEYVNETYFKTMGIDKTSVINQTIHMLEKVLVHYKDEAKIAQIQKEQESVQGKKQVLMEKLLDGIISDRDYQLQNQVLDDRLCKLETEERALNQQLNEQKDLKCRLQNIRENLENGGYEKAATGQMLNYVQEIIVHEWQLEIRFDAFLMTGITLSQEMERKVLNGEERYSSVFVDYPFSPNTEKGRYLDRLEIIKLIKEDPKRTAKVLAEKMSRSPYMVRNRMEELIADGYIRFHGKGGKGNWEVLKDLEDIRKRRLNDT